jgi:hypothetical protein
MTRLATLLLVPAPAALAACPNGRRPRPRARRGARQSVLRATSAACVAF